MTQQNPIFDISEFELRNYTSPYLTPAQATEVADTETRVNEQLDFLAQMLGWNGPNYWGNLASTVNQKRQLLGGTFGVYNSYVIPRIYEIRNWTTEIKNSAGEVIKTIVDAIVVDRVQFLQPGRQTQVARILLGDNVYQLQSVEVEGDKYLISIGELTQEFFDLIAANEPLRVDIPTYRPAPFRRADIGTSGDFSFVCGRAGSDLVLYPAYDTEKKFPVKYPILFAGAVYYFNQPVYLSLDDTLTPEVSPSYDASRELWHIQIPGTLVNTVGITACLAQANSDPTQANNYSLEVTIQPWQDPSDWGSINVLDNFKGVWGNKGGDLPFNFVFDALSIHGFSEKDSVYLPKVETSLNFNDIVNFIYYQKTTVSELAPGAAKPGDLWWNDETGALAVWLPSENGCEGWVEIDYRQSPRQIPPPQVTYLDVTTFRANAASLSVGSIVRIEDTTGLSVSDNVLGVQGTLTSAGRLVLHRDTDAPYWTPDEFSYTNVSDFATDALLLPMQVPVVIYNAAGLTSSTPTYTISNLSITISGDYDVLLMKYYTDTNWEIFPDSVLKYIAKSSLFKSPLQGEMWWDFANPDPNTRAAAIFYSSPSPLVPLSSLEVVDGGSGIPDGTYGGVSLYTLSGVGANAEVTIDVLGGSIISATVTSGGANYVLEDLVSPRDMAMPELQGTILRVTETASQAWTSVNYHAQSGAPLPPLDLDTVLFYCNGQLLAPGVAYVDDDRYFTYFTDPATGEFDIEYIPRTFAGQVQFPTIAISDSLTTVYRADITGLVFSGVTYYMSPNVYNAETPLRLWKAQDLQVAETVNHLEEDNYINPLLADLNNGPGPENWEKYFVRLPLEYGRDEAVWQKVALICQDFAYWGSSVDPEQMRCPPEDDLPAIYEELFLYDQPVSDYTYVYSEPYLYSNIAYSNSVESGGYQNSGVFPASDVQFDEFSEAEFVEYEPLHDRQADVVSPINQGYGNWLGEYVNVNPCVALTGFFTTDLLNGGISPVAAPVWDASIYKFAPTCENAKESYNVDANHYKVGYAYFVADASAAEDSFFDISKEASWRYTATQPRGLYLVPPR
jgi:hypothetical protein